MEPEQRLVTVSATSEALEIEPGTLVGRSIDGALRKYRPGDVLLGRCESIDVAEGRRPTVTLKVRVKGEAQGVIRYEGEHCTAEPPETPATPRVPPVELCRWTRNEHNDRRAVLRRPDGCEPHVCVEALSLDAMDAAQWEGTVAPDDIARALLELAKLVASRVQVAEGLRRAATICHDMVRYSAKSGGSPGHALRVAVDEIDSQATEILRAGQ